MENNENYEVTEVTAPAQEQVMVQQEAAPVISEKKGMTTGQKLAGLGLIGFAVAGIVWLVTGIVKLVKKVVAKLKTPKEAPAQQAAAPAPAPAVTQEPAPTAPQETPAEPEQK